MRFFVFAALCVWAARAHAQQPRAAPPGFVRQTVDSVAAIVTREYFAPDVGERVARMLKQSASAGDYDASTTAERLAKRITSDLYDASHDKHLAVTVRTSSPAGGESDRASTARRENFGVRRVEVLPLNVGYLAVTSFYRPEEARIAFSLALRLLATADALILDLRQNTGGSPDMVAEFLGSFIADSAAALFDIVPRGAERGRSYVTGSLPGVERNAARPMYVLTSSRTFSAGEGAAFLLQERRRARVVGERTAGAANPGRNHAINDQLEVTVPNGQVRSAIGGGNWEGRGVVPDIEAAESEALDTAQICALRDIIRIHGPGRWRDAAQQRLATLERQRPHAVECGTTVR